MKNILPLLLLISFISCTTSKTPKVDPNIETCYILYNLTTKTYVKMDNTKSCRTQYPAASTFKIPLAVMAFDSGILKDEHQVIKWDGQKRMLDQWNKDADAVAWLRDSVVWFSQEITKRMGEEKLQRYLNDFEYGNKDLSSGIKYAWLTPSPFTKDAMSNSLRLTGRDQVLFLRDLWENKLPATLRAQELTKKILASESTPAGNTLSGKTGSGFIGLHNELRLGWFVGYLHTPQTDYIVVSNFVDKVKSTNTDIFSGKAAKELLKARLAEENLW